MRLVVVGAGVAGLTAARELVDAGHDVVVLDKGRSPGGRLATRRLAGATVDHGAQFFTVRTEPFAAAVARWQGEGLVREWCRGFAGREDGHPRYCVNGGMNALAKRMARGLDVRSGVLAFAVHRRPGGWTVQQDDAATWAADAVVLTCPVAQARSLAITAELDVPTGMAAFDYDPTMALLAVLDGPGTVPPAGGVRDADGTFSFVADNHAKGVSALPALTLHANANWSRAHLDDDREAVHAELLDAAAAWCGGARVVASQVKRWRFAAPQQPRPEPCLVLEGGPGPLVLAGDGFAGAKVEGAYTSGRAAAFALRPRR